MFELETEKVFEVLSKYVNLQSTKDMIKICDKAYFEEHVNEFNYEDFYAATVRLDNGSIYIIIHPDFYERNKQDQNFIILHELIHAYSYRIINDEYVSGIYYAKNNKNPSLINMNESLTDLITKMLYSEVFENNPDSKLFKSLKEKLLSKIVGKKLSKEEFLKIYFVYPPEVFEEYLKNNFTKSSLNKKRSLIKKL